MASLDQWLPSHDSLTGTFTLLVFAAGLVMAAVFVSVAASLRESGVRGGASALWFGGVVLISAGLVWGWLNQTVQREQTADRRALDQRMVELIARAISPGSPLACLDGIGIDAVDAGCVQGLFASPQTVAAAVSYTNAKLSLLADGLAFASREKSYGAELKELRRGLEADRFGVVAYVLAARGCNAEECPQFKLFSDPSQIKTNLGERNFEALVIQHAARWQSENGPAATASVGAPAVPPVSATPPAGPITPPGSKYSFPSSSSIPPVSIMSAEPTGPEPSAGPPDKPTGSTKRQASKRPPPVAGPMPPPQGPPQATIANPNPAVRQ